MRTGFWRFCIWKASEYVLDLPIGIPCSIEALATLGSHCFPVSQHLSTNGSAIQWNDTNTVSPVKTAG